MVAAASGHGHVLGGPAPGLTQAQLAQRMDVGQRQVSKIEHGDLENTCVGTIRKYLRAVGGDISLDWVMGDQRASLV